MRMHAHMHMQAQAQAQLHQVLAQAQAQAHSQQQQALAAQQQQLQRAFEESAKELHNEIARLREQLTGATNQFQARLQQEAEKRAVLEEESARNKDLAQVKKKN